LRLPRYYGIAEGYPRLRRRAVRLADYIALLRPFTLLAPLVAGVFLTLAAEGLGAFVKGLWIGLVLALAQGAGQVLNQVVDVELDKLAKPYRPISSDRISEEEALGFTYLLTLTAVCGSFLVSTYFGLMTCLLLFFAAFYSLPPLSPRKVSPWLNLLWISFSRSFLPFVAVMGLGGLPYAALAFIWAFGWQGTKDLPDAEADRRFGIKTVANTCGPSFLHKMSAASTATYVVAALALLKPFMLLAVPLAVYGLLRYNKRWLGENTTAWAVFYLGLGLIALLTMLSELVVSML
jgi:4-hydroxybenzoate polyprenyltransferase